MASVVPPVFILHSRFVKNRSGLEGWNALSYTMTLEQMLESIVMPVKNWRKKNKN